MKVRICEVNAAALDRLPGKMEDKCGIGAHYVDAYLKPMNVKLEDGTPVRAKRKGPEDHAHGGNKERRRPDAPLGSKRRSRGDARSRAAGSRRGGGGASDC